MCCSSAQRNGVARCNSESSSVGWAQYLDRAVTALEGMRCPPCPSLGEVSEMELGFARLASLTTACRRHEHPSADAAGVNAAPPFDTAVSYGRRSGYFWEKR